MKKIIKQQIVLKCYKEYLEADKEQLKQEFIKTIQETPADELIDTEERESCFHLRLECIVK
jgi:hypothetical protein